MSFRNRFRLLKDKCVRTTLTAFSKLTLNRSTRAIASALAACACITLSYPSFAHKPDIEALYFYEPEGRLSFQQVANSNFFSELGQPFVEADVPLGNGSHWVLIDLQRNEAAAPSQWLLEISFANVDEIQALVEYADGQRYEYISGDEIAYNAWPVDYRKPTLPLFHLDEHSAKVYLRVINETPLSLPLSLVTVEQQLARQQTELFWYGIFYGAIVILALYNAVMFVSLKDKSYLYYVLYVLAFTMVQASTTGMGQQFLWPTIDNATTRIALLAIILTNCLLVRFVIHFLSLEKYRPRLGRALHWLSLIVLIPAPFLALPHYAYTQFVIHTLSAISMAAVVASTLSVFSANRRPAIYLLASYSVLFSAISLALLFQAGLIDHFHSIDYILAFAILVEAVVLSIGLSDRIATLRIQNERGERERRINQEKLSQQLIKTRENERAEISEILHDTVNHDLAVARKRLEKIADLDQQGRVEGEHKTAEIDELLEKVINDVRNIAHLSHPQIVRHLGLEPALRSLLEKSFDYSMQWDLYLDEVPLSYDAQVFLYRAVQECITNIIKHSNASECLVRLHYHEESHRVQFTIRDDGSGFDASPEHWGFGLRILNEHCKSFGGTLTLQSTQQGGTTVSILLPVASQDLYDEQDTTVG
ncbi:MAG: 7TM diverse intracellular signaling domain-containing protein [Pseudomonadota bacterium]